MKILLALSFILSTTVYAASGLNFDLNKTDFEVLENAFNKSKNMSFEEIISEDSARKTGKYYKTISHIGPQGDVGSTVILMLTTSIITKSINGELGRGPLFPGTADTFYNNKQIQWCLDTGLKVECTKKDKEFDQEYPEGETLTMISPNYIHIFKRYSKKVIVIQVEDRNTRDISYSYAWLE